MIATKSEMLELARVMERHPETLGEPFLQPGTREWDIVVEALRVAAEVKP